MALASNIGGALLRTIGFVDEGVGQCFHDPEGAIFILFLFFALLLQRLRIVNEVIEAVVFRFLLLWSKRLTVHFHQHAGGGIPGFDNQLGLGSFDGLLEVPEHVAGVIASRAFILDRAADDLGCRWLRVLCRKARQRTAQRDQTNAESSSANRNAHLAPFLI